MAGTCLSISVWSAARSAPGKGRRVDEATCRLGSTLLCSGGAGSQGGVAAGAAVVPQHRGCWARSDARATALDRHRTAPHRSGGPEVAVTTVPASPRTLKRVAEKLAEWGDAGLAPLADTRRDPRQQPVRLDFDLKLADIRSEAETRVSAVNTA